MRTLKGNFNTSEVYFNLTVVIFPQMPRLGFVARPQLKSYPSLSQLLADERADPAGESYLPRDVTAKAVCYLSQLGEQ